MINSFKKKIASNVKISDNKEVLGKTDSIIYS